MSKLAERWKCKPIFFFFAASLCSVFLFCLSAQQGEAEQDWRGVLVSSGNGEKRWLPRQRKQPCAYRIPF